MNSRPFLLALAAITLFSAGCGGGGGGNNDNDNEFEFETLTLQIDRADSGYISENGFVSDDSDAFVGTIPDISGFLEQRGILTFDLPGLPSGAELVSAELRTLQGPPTGSPYPQVVNIIVDHIASIGTGMQATDFFSNPRAVIATPPLSNNELQEIKALDVTDQVADDLASDNDVARFRLRGQAINPLTAGNNDPVDPVDLARFRTSPGETVLEIVIRSPVN